jgi:2-succinyl-5-enolpyruvyl-6-hydroxy-3-cyclohexene-1-carboxylate synthase
MKLPKIPLAQTVVKLCELKDIKHIVISPGSRNAPLTIGFSNHPFFKCYSIVDERCAAFFALGIAQQTQKPVALVCTSGSALLNYFPAVAEAYYSDIPLVILSADRPEYLIGIGDGQTIDQKHVFANHILYESALKEDIRETINKTSNPPIAQNLKDNKKTLGDIQKQIQQFNETEINNALNTAITEKGPVHLNVPFNEPLYELVESIYVNPEVIPLAKKNFDQHSFSSFIDAWNSAKRKMIVIGVNNPKKLDKNVIQLFEKDESVLVFTETTSNVHGNEFFPSIDKIIAPLNDEEFEELQPDMLVTMGGMIVSKKIKSFLRKYSPELHYHIDSKKAYDTFFKLSKHIKQTPNSYFTKNVANLKQLESDYRKTWKEVKEKREIKHQKYIDDIPYSDLKAFDAILKSLPDNINVHSGNSSAIRYMQLFNINKSWKVFCNRGTSGIDGSTSTAIGASVVSYDPTVFITGDLSFFYDSNALWNNYIPNSFRIILINNSGGGIFRILPGHKNTKNFDIYFETKHDLNSKSLCEMFQFEYRKANHMNELKDELAGFYSESERPRLLEVFTPRKINDEVLLNYFDILR